MPSTRRQYNVRIDKTYLGWEEWGSSGESSRARVAGEFVAAAGSGDGFVAETKGGVGSFSSGSWDLLMMRLPVGFRHFPLSRPSFKPGGLGFERILGDSSIHRAALSLYSLLLYSPAESKAQ